MIITQAMADADINLKNHVGDMLANENPPHIVDACVAFSALLIPDIVPTLDVDVAAVIAAHSVSDLVAAHGNLPALYETVSDIYIRDISRLAAIELDQGFISNALGTDHTYPVNDSEQINLIGAVSVGAPAKLRCDDGSGEVFKTHNAAQLRNVLEDGVSFKSSLVEKRAGKNNSIAAIMNGSDTTSKKLLDLSLVTW